MYTMLHFGKSENVKREVTELISCHCFDVRWLSVKGDGNAVANNSSMKMIMLSKWTNFLFPIFSISSLLQALKPQFLHVNKMDKLMSQYLAYM